jgi:hypothetical protein
MISKQKRKSLLLTGLTMLAVMVLMPLLAFAHSIDYLAAAISPAANFNGQSGNFTLINSVTGGDEISFNLTFSINTQGSTTTYPRTITFGVLPPPGPTDPIVYFGATGMNTTYQCTFTSASSNFTTQVRITAPAADGAYSVHISAIDGTGGQKGLSPGGGITVTFTVSNPAPPSCNQDATSLSLTLVPACVVFHATSATFSATLTSDDSPLAGKLIAFTVDGNDVGSVSTDDKGVATLVYDPSALSVGDHTVAASFQGDGCDYESSGNSATLGVTYDFLGFQPPVQIDGVGAGLFSGKVIPVKIKIADALGMPVPDAQAFVFFGQTSADVTSEAADSVNFTTADPGNQMRYDPLADQYIFNWDTSKLANGSYNIRIDLGEGSCAGNRLATVILQKSSGKKK